jgi:hypothetical protein
MERDYNISKITEVKKITGRGIIECLRALKRADWDVQNAVKYLCQISENTIEIGCIREIYKDGQYPFLLDLINKPIKEKEKVIEYMKTSKIQAVAPGIFRDLINPENKIPYYFVIMTDGKYSWRSDVIYYMENMTWSCQMNLYNML